MTETITEASPRGADVAAGASWTRLVMWGGAVLAVLLLGAALGMSLQRGTGVPALPENNSVDIGFAQDMSVHHRQAILMAGLARDRSTDPEIRSLAFDIETSQLEQVGRMQGWLSLWDASALPTGRYMTWMTHGGGAGIAVMPGMASPTDLARLRASSGAQFDVLFLQLILRHHQGGAPMATYTAQHAETVQVRNLAEKIVVSQGTESDYLTQLITQRGAQPLPPPS